MRVCKFVFRYNVFIFVFLEFLNNIKRDRKKSYCMIIDFVYSILLPYFYSNAFSCYFEYSIVIVLFWHSIYLFLFLRKSILHLASLIKILQKFYYVNIFGTFFYCIQETSSIEKLPLKLKIIMSAKTFFSEHIGNGKEFTPLETENREQL